MNGQQGGTRASKKIMVPPNWGGLRFIRAVDRPIDSQVSSEKKRCLARDNGYVTTASGVVVQHPTHLPPASSRAPLPESASPLLQPASRPSSDPSVPSTWAVVCRSSDCVQPFMAKAFDAVAVVLVDPDTPAAPVSPPSPPPPAPEPIEDAEVGLIRSPSRGSR